MPNCLVYILNVLNKDKLGITFDYTNLPLLHKVGGFISIQECCF